MAGQAAVITGASTGIGRACALHLDKLGFQVFAGVRKEEDGARLQQHASGYLTPVLIDITDPTSIVAAVEFVTAVTAGLGLAGLVNNAGIAVAGPLEFLPVDLLRQQFEVNVLGQIAVTQAFLPLLRQGRGRVINIGSIGGKMALPFIGAYTASKFALEALTDSLRVELQPWDIHVSIIEPGSITTSIWHKSKREADKLAAEMPQQAHELYGPAIAAFTVVSKKTGQAGMPPQAVAEAVAHALTAARPKTRYIVGRDAKIQAILAKFVPDRLRDNLIMQQLGLSRANNLLPPSLLPKLLAGIIIGLVIGGLLIKRK